MQIRSTSTNFFYRMVSNNSYTCQPTTEIIPWISSSLALLIRPSPLSILLTASFSYHSMIHFHIQHLHSTCRFWNCWTSLLHRLLCFILRKWSALNFPRSHYPTLSKCGWFVQYIRLYHGNFHGKPPQLTCTPWKNKKFAIKLAARGSTKSAWSLNTYDSSSRA